MKIIISYQNGRTEMLSVASLDNIEFQSSSIVITFSLGNTTYIQYSDIRSIVIA